MQIETLLDDFFQNVPEIQDLFHHFCNEQNLDLSEDVHVIWEYGIMPCITCLLRYPDEFGTIADRVFQFIEDTLVAEQNMSAFWELSMMFCLYDQVEEIVQQRAVRFMRPKTKRVWDEHCAFMKSSKLLQLAQLYSDEEMDAMGIQYEYLS